MQTTLTISDSIVERLRKRAADEGRPIQKVIEDCLALGLERLEHESINKEQAYYSVEVHDAGLQADIDPLSFNNLTNQLDSETHLP